MGCAETKSGAETDRWNDNKSGEDGEEFAQHHFSENSPPSPSSLKTQSSFSRESLPVGLIDQADLGPVVLDPRALVNVTEAVLEQAVKNSNIYWSSCGTDSPDARTPSREPLSPSVSVLSPGSLSMQSFDDSWREGFCTRRSHKKRMRTELHVMSTMAKQASQRLHMIIENPRDMNDFYDVDKNILGQGAFGSVWRAKVKATSAVRAIKSVMKARMPRMDILRKEIKITKMVDHPNIIKLYEIYEDGVNIYLVMECCDGGHLDARLKQAGKFSEPQTAVLLRQILRGVCYLHESRICHRDLKPENFLMLTKVSVEESPLKIADFGLSCTFKTGQIMTSRTGTPFYMAPEIFKGAYDYVCDIWSCGVISYQMLSGSLPFIGKCKEELISNIMSGRFAFPYKNWTGVSEGAICLICALLLRDPQKRLDARQSLEDVWLARLAPHQEGKLESSVVENLRSFRSLNKFKRAALCVVASLLSDEQIRAPREAFTTLDVDGDGVITVSEMRQGLDAFLVETKPMLKRQLTRDVKAIMAEGGAGVNENPDSPGRNGRRHSHVEALATAVFGDKTALTVSVSSLSRSASGIGERNTSGIGERNISTTGTTSQACAELSYTEFLAATFDRDSCCTEDVCRAAFQVFDQDGSGLIEKTELSNGQVLGHLSEPELEKLVQDLDQNGDGEIDFEEFMDMMRQNLN